VVDVRVKYNMHHQSCGARTKPMQLKMKKVIEIENETLKSEYRNQKD
jgi:hypothetical protein